MALEPSELFAEFKLNGPADPAHLASFEQWKGLKLPADYVAFMSRHNGGVGSIGESYLAMYPAEELIEVNEGYDVQVYAPGAVYFATDLGNEAFAFDLRSAPAKIVMIPFIGSGWSDAVPIGASMDSFFEALFVGAQFK